MAGAISATTIFSGLSAAAGVGGVGLQAAGAIKGGKAATSTALARQKMAYYQAQVGQNNAAIARQYAAYAMESGQIQTQKQSLQGAAKFGRLKAGQAASGVNANSGSAVDVQASERELNQLDSETVLSNAALKAYGYNVQANNYEAQSTLDTAQGNLYGQGAEDASSAGYLKAGGSLLSGASSLPWGWLSGDGKNQVGADGTSPAAAAGFPGASPFTGP